MFKRDADFHNIFLKFILLVANRMA